MWLCESEDSIEPVFCHVCKQVMRGDIYIQHWRSCTEEKQLTSQLAQINRAKFEALAEKPKQKSLQRKIVNEQRQENREIEAISCPLCSKQLCVEQLATHNSICPASKIQCQHCSQQIQIMSLDQHEKNCSKNKTNEIFMKWLSQKNRNGISNINRSNQVEELLSESVFPSLKNIDKGMKKKQIQKIPVSKYRGALQADSMCIICQQQFKEDDLIMKLSCSHIYHKQCCKEWLMINSTCSVCKAPITTT